MWLPLLVLLGLIFLFRWNRQRQILPNLSEKYVLITGCDSGFGNLLAKQLDKRGLRVVAACLTEKGAEDLKKETSSRLQTVLLDVTDSQSVKSAANWLSLTVGNGGLWGLVNNAGFGYTVGPNEWQRKEDFVKVLDVNYLGMVDVTLHLLPLIRRAHGRIVNVASAAGRLSVFGGGYCPSKFAVEAFSDSLRREMCNFGVKVSIIEPGAFKTAMTMIELHKKNLHRLWKNLPTEVKETYGEQYCQQNIAASIMWLPLLVLLGLIFLFRWNRQRQILQNLSEKYVLITGCDSGFGNLLAKQLDKRGLRVVAACLTEKGAEDLKKETSSRLQTVLLDITDSQSVKSAANWLSLTVGNRGLWGLVNNAGFGCALGPNEWNRKEDFVKVLDVNYLGMVDVTIHLLPLIRRARGRIVNVASAAGRLSIIGGGYCPSKFAVEAFSDSLRREMRNFGVNVSIIEPGAFKTAMTLFEPHRNFLDQAWKNLPKEVKEAYGEQYYQQCAQSLQKYEVIASQRLYKVTDCMEHALIAVHPWTRYSPGWDCKLYYIPLSYLPTAISDYMLYLSAPKINNKTE
ncbi:retinol dehydrogenase 7-like [Rhinophrynus dorsalis]